MARRKSKKPQLGATCVSLDSSVPRPRRGTNSIASPALLLITLAVGASVMATFCVQQQHSLDQLSESFTTMQRTVTSLQQVTQRTGAQADAGLSMVKRLFALEEAQKKAEEKARSALDASEEMRSPVLYSQLWGLHDEMDTRLAEMKRVALSVTTLQASFKNKSEELEAVRVSVVAGLRSSSALAENVAGLANAVARAFSRADQQVASVEALNGQLDGHALELNELGQSVHRHNAALHRNNQELAAMRELVEAKQAMRAQALAEMLGSVQKTLDEQFSTSQTLHSSVLAQLQTFPTQLVNAPSRSTNLKSDEGGPAEEEFNSARLTMQDAAGLHEKLKDVEERTEQQNVEDEAQEETEEEEAVQKEPGVEADVTQQKGKDISAEAENKMTPEEDEDEEITGQSEEHEAEEGVAEETVDRHVLDQSLEEEESQDVVENWETVEEVSAEVNVFLDENEEGN